jgi:hypothetical protein
MSNNLHQTVTHVNTCGVERDQNGVYLRVVSDCETRHGLQPIIYRTLSRELAAQICGAALALYGALQLERAGSAFTLAWPTTAVTLVSVPGAIDHVAAQLFAGEQLAEVRS